MSIIDPIAKWAGNYPNLAKLLVELGIIPRFWPPGHHDSANDAILQHAEMRGAFKICNFDGVSLDTACGKTPGTPAYEPYLTFLALLREGMARRGAFKNLFPDRLATTKSKIVKDLFRGTKDDLHKSKNSPVPKKGRDVPPVRGSSKRRGKVGT